MLKFIQPILIVLLYSTTAVAQINSLQIEGPHDIEPGKLVRLAANTLENETPFWIVLEPTNLDYEVVNNGKQLLLSSGCKSNVSITVMLLAQQVKDGRIITRQVRRKIIVSDQDGDAPSSSPPDKRPQPPKNDQVVQSPIYNPVFSAWPKVRTDAAKELSLSVAMNFEKVALKCEANEFENPGSIWKELSSLNRQTLQIETEAWEPVALELQKTLKGLKPKTVPEHALHFRAAALAIRNAFQKNNESLPSSFPVSPAQGAKQ